MAKRKRKLQKSKATSQVTRKAAKKAARVVFSPQLIEAAKAANLTDEQIAAYDDEASLRAVVNRLKPTILSGAGVPSPP